MLKAKVVVVVITKDNSSGGEVKEELRHLLLLLHQLADLDLLRNLFLDPILVIIHHLH